MAANTGQIQKVRNHPINSDRIGKPVCPECGFRIRGKLANHMRGDHHKRNTYKKK